MAVVKSHINTSPAGLGHQRAYIPDTVLGQSWTFMLAKVVLFGQLRFARLERIYIVSSISLD